MASKGKAPAKASSTRVHGSTSQQQPSLEIRLYETPAHEERGKILERKALHERTIKFPEGKDTFEERILARGWGFIGKYGYSEISEAYNNKTLNMDEVLQVIVCLASVMRYAMNADLTKSKTHLLIFPMFITKWARDNNVPRFPGDIMRIMRRHEQLMLMLHPGLDTSGLEQISSPDISQNPQGQRARSAEKENAEEDDDFQSAEATGDASTYVGEESVDDE
ncbi:hypothetical protein PIB30_085417 [Stylosanthes scabra]|uniref:Uncharacterized protein n=1 Tax=Stylosanthes scabra TaxID=79078 RepID=A0ABU6XRV8_9FABA|nr:hypothetical protein [Stylosanthes scabra]